MKQYLLLLVLCLTFSSCTKDEAGRIPEVPVNFRAPLNHPQLAGLNSGGGIVVIEGYGVAGLIICRTPAGYKAFDRCSSVNPEQQCKVIPDAGGLTATDPCSGAKFSLLDGTPDKAPAKRPLKEYHVAVTQFDISVTNNY